VTIFSTISGSPLSLNALREDLQVAFDTVKGWLATLERFYFLFELRPFSGRLARHKFPWSCTACASKRPETRKKLLGPRLR